MNDIIETLDERGRWRARDVTYWGGNWEQLGKQIPFFQTGDFTESNDGSVNPYMKTVIRLPLTKMERPIPVGVVSNTYTLAQHTEVVEKCFQGIRDAGIDAAGLRCELGLTELGEWMNFRIYFPKKYDYESELGDNLALRLEVFNSVDGSSRLVILLGWFRFLCSNGMVIGETKTELRDIHNERMNLEKIPDLICKGLGLVKIDIERLNVWANTKVEIERIGTWVNSDVANRWGKKAACRVFHICESGADVEISDPFARGSATEKPVKFTSNVPGAAKPAETLFDVSQSLSWVATKRKNSEERVDWQSAIPALIKLLENRLSG